MCVKQNACKNPNFYRISICCILISVVNNVIKKFLEILILKIIGKLIQVSNVR